MLPRVASERRYAQLMTTVDLRTLRLRPGEVRRETVDVELEPFVLAGQRYEATPGTIPVQLEISQASGATILDIRLDIHISGACMRCLGFAEIARHVRAREFHDLDAPRSDELSSDYVVDEHLQLSTWARDAVAHELPDQILCREDCAGLCPVCGKDLNEEPHEHVDREPDPRWAALETLRDEL
jgi:uncharacterized protein